MDTRLTTDLSLAGAILAAVHKLSRVDRGWFIFEADPRIAATVTQYIAGGLQVDVRTFADHLPGLKGALHALARVQR